MRGRIAGQRPAVQRDAVPGDALHVRHPGIVIEARVVVLVLLDDGEDAGRRLASRGAGRHRRAQDPAVGIVESDLLGLDRHDRHDRFARIARRRCLGGWRGARLSRRGVSGQRRQCGDRRERHNGGRPPRRVATVDCAVVNRFTMPSPVEMPLRACVDQVSDRDFGKTNGRHRPRQFAPGVIGPFRRQISHIRQPSQEEGRLAAEIGAFQTWPGLADDVRSWGGQADITA